MLMTWREDCGDKQNCTIQVPRVKITTCDNASSKFNHSMHQCREDYGGSYCYAHRVNVRYQCVPGEARVLLDAEVAGNLLLSLAKP